MIKKSLLLKGEWFFYIHLKMKGFAGYFRQSYSISVNLNLMNKYEVVSKVNFSTSLLIYSLRMFKINLFCENLAI